MYLKQIKTNLLPVNKLLGIERNILQSSFTPKCIFLKEYTNKSLPQIASFTRPRPRGLR